MTNDTIIIGLKVIIAICACVSGYCAWEIWQDWKENKRLDKLLRAGFQELRKRGEL